MKIALASFRRSADEIRAEGVQVNIVNLARKLNASQNTVRSYLQRVTGLKEELKVTEQRIVRSCKYTIAIAQLHEARLIVTRHRIAALTNSKYTAVRGWLVRHPLVIVRGHVVDEKTFTRMCLVQRLRWCGKYAARHKDGRLILSHLAKAARIDRCYLHKMLATSAVLKTEILHL